MRVDIRHLTLPESFHEMTDFYLPEEKPMYGVAYPDAQPLRKLPEYNDVILSMLEAAKSSPKLEFSLELINESGYRVLFRGHSIQSIEGKVYILRRLPSNIPSIEKIGMPPPIIELLTDKNLNRGGLIIIAGETGQGKSTTAAATIAHRLSHFGSFCLTIENPVELPLQGFYGEDNEGVCFQTEVDDDGILDAIKSSLRCYPSVSNSILFLGEIRDGMMASEVLKVAANGHLVITTMHGSNLITSLKRFISLAAGYMPGNNAEAEVKSIFSSVFRLLIHQRMETLHNGKKRLMPEILFSSHSASPIANRLKSNNLDALATEIQSQNMTWTKGGSLKS